MSGDAIELDAPAKLTTTLRITGVRPDGYHLIDAEMVSLDLADRLTLTPWPGGANGACRLTVSGPFAAGVPTDGSNLVARAWRVVDGPAMAVHIDKQIPSGGGLGGGSADAAAILAWAGQADADVAARLGADVAFCVRGGRARVTGIGERLEPRSFVAATYTLVVPPFGCSTVEVYRAWDRLGPGAAADAATWSRNDLEPAALAVEPRLAHWRDEIVRRCGIEPTLAGSGSTWFVAGARDDALAGLTDEGAVVRTVRTTPARRID